MHYKPILYAGLVAILTLPAVGSREIPVNPNDKFFVKQCVEGSLPLEQRVGDTNYVRVNEGSPQKVFYFIPNVHWRGDRQRDEQAMQSLIESDRVDALMFEGLEYTGRPEPMENVEINLNSALVETIRKHNIPVFGTESYETRRKALSVEKAYLMNKIIGRYQEYLSEIILLEQLGIKEHSSADFKRKFLPVIEAYDKEIQQFKKDYPSQDFSEESKDNLSKRQREIIALDSLSKVSNRFGRIAILWGGEHIPEFVTPLCDSGFTILVAQDDDIPDDKKRELIKKGETLLPKDLERIFQISYQIDGYYLEARKEAGFIEN